jgi:hypothetical protein
MFASIIAPYIGGIIYEISIYYPFIIAIGTSLALALTASYKNLKV